MSKIHSELLYSNKQNSQKTLVDTDLLVTGMFNNFAKKYGSPRKRSELEQFVQKREMKHSSRWEDTMRDTNKLYTVLRSSKDEHRCLKNNLPYKSVLRRKVYHFTTTAVRSKTWLKRKLIWETVPEIIYLLRCVQRSRLNVLHISTNAA